MSATNFQAAGLHVAVVEDDDELCGLVVDDLNARGCNAVGLPSAEALYRHMTVHPVDILVLDIGLPGESGFGVTAHLRQSSNIGIILLTGRKDSGSMARGLADGADLFLTKPVDFGVLAIAVANLHLRRASGDRLPGAAATGGPAWALADGGWTLQAPCAGSLALNEAERAILLVLFQCQGEPVSRVTLIEALTPDPVSFDPHRLDMLVHRLRARVSGAFKLSLPLRAVRGTGYVLTP